MLWDLKASCGKGNKSNFVWDGRSEGVEDTKTVLLGESRARVREQYYHKT